MFHVLFLFISSKKLNIMYRPVITEFELKGLVYQIKHLNNKKPMSNEGIAFYLKRFLSEKGVPVERVDKPIIQ
jgi:hypothetical protein